MFKLQKVISAAIPNRAVNVNVCRKHDVIAARNGLKCCWPSHSPTALRVQPDKNSNIAYLLMSRSYCPCKLYEMYTALFLLTDNDSGLFPQNKQCLHSWS
eukprot:scaffold359594_cov20-Prasinocladus_malaysianus.AAC.1